jgi:hypothetical protein
MRFDNAEISCRSNLAAILGEVAPQVFGRALRGYAAI